MTKKISISLPDDLEEAARYAAEAEGIPVSTWLARAARRELTERALLVDGRAAIAEEIAEHGEFVVTPEEEAWVDGVLSSSGLAERPGQRTAS